MAKQVIARVKLVIPGGNATPGPPVGPVLAPYGIKLPEFCKKFNDATANKRGEMVPVAVTLYKDKTFDFRVKTPQTSGLILKMMKIQKGSSNPSKESAGTISMKDIEEIARIKMPDLNTGNIEEAKKIIAGSARSMGIEVKE